MSKIIKISEDVHKKLLGDNNINENFSKWFNGSKIIEDGKPMICYHGSPDNNMTEFKISKIGSNTDSGMFGRGFYFTDDKKYADTYNRTGKGLTYSFYLSIKIH